MHKRMKISLITVLCVALLTPINITSASATPNITATGTNPSICNQEVGNTLNVVAYRLAGGDCVIEFKNNGSTTWTVPAGVTAVSVLVVGGGGGGGSRAAGGGGGGGFSETTNYLVTAGQIHAITVGAGGPGAASSSAADGSAGTASSFLRNAVGLTAIGGAGGLDHLTPGFGKGGASGSATGTGAVSSNAGGAQLGNGNCAGNWCGGGGGGAGAVGANAVSTGGGAGGNGRASSNTGTLITYAGGGGGGSGSNSNTPTPGGAGGSGGGGAGTTSTQNSCIPQNGTNGSANLGGGGGGAGYCITPNTQGTGGSGGSGVVIIRYAMDTTAPTFTSSSSISAAENIAISAIAATIRVSESATVTISSGADAARFNITRSETNTVLIKFNTSPDFESPADVGGNNVYELTLTATDVASNAGTQSITITVTDVVDTSSFNSLALAGSATTATYRTVVVVNASITVASKVTFRVNGRVLPGCIKKSATGSGSTFLVTCNWRPSNRGVVALTAIATPSGAGISSASATPVRVMVGNRSGNR